MLVILPLVGRVLNKLVGGVRGVLDMELQDKAIGI